MKSQLVLALSLSVLLALPPAFAGEPTLRTSVSAPVLPAQRVVVMGEVDPNPGENPRENPGENGNHEETEDDWWYEQRIHQRSFHVKTIQQRIDGLQSQIDPIKEKMEKDIAPLQEALDKRTQEKDKQLENLKKEYEKWRGKYTNEKNPHKKKKIKEEVDKIRKQIDILIKDFNKFSKGQKEKINKIKKEANDKIRPFQASINKLQKELTQLKDAISKLEDERRDLIKRETVNEDQSGLTIEEAIEKVLPDAEAWVPPSYPLRFIMRSSALYVCPGHDEVYNYYHCDRHCNSKYCLTQQNIEEVVYDKQKDQFYRVTLDYFGNYKPKPIYQVYKVEEIDTPI